MRLTRVPASAATATVKATRTATGLRKLIGAGSTGGGSAAAGTSSGSTSVSSSLCGFPHLWQKTASGGSCAPQLQISGIKGNYSLTQGCAGKQLKLTEPHFHVRLILQVGGFNEADARGGAGH